MSVNNESAAFNKLGTLCSEAGYIHIIAFYCFSNLSDSSQRYELNLIEINTLIGLMIKNNQNIDYTLPNLDDFESMIIRTKTLLENHDHIIKQNSYNNIHRNFSLRDAIIYGAESAYEFQYINLCKKRYANDSQWIQKNKGFTLDDCLKVVHGIRNIQNLKVESFLKDKNNICQNQWLSVFRFTIDELSSNVNLEPKITESILNCFSNHQFQQLHIKTFNSMTQYNVMTSHPIIKVGDNEYILFLVRNLLESLYNTPKYWLLGDKSYRDTAEKNKGIFAEKMSELFFKTLFNNECVFRGVSIRDCNNQEIAEIDVLVIFNNSLIISQVKSKSMTVNAKCGDNSVLEDDFKKAIQKAYNQAIDCRDKILNQSVSLIYNDKKITLSSNINKIYISCILSDHYPALFIQVKEYIKLSDVQNISSPLVIDIFTLSTITKIFPSPQVLINYLDWRDNIYNRTISGHELNVLGFYLSKKPYPPNGFISNEFSCCVDNEIEKHQSYQNYINDLC